MFLINGKSYDLKRIDLSSKLGVVEDWIVINKSHMDHPSTYTARNLNSSHQNSMAKFKKPNLEPSEIL